MTADLRSRVEFALKHEIAPALLLDGNGIEVYVDASDVWRREPQRVAQLMPLEL